MNKLVLLSLTLAACTHDIAEFDRIDAVETGGNLDILYVMDTSADRASYDTMAGQLGDLTAGLAQIDGQVPSLHVGVVTADLGATGTDDAAPRPAFRNCAGDGDGGRLAVFDAQLGKSYLEDLRGPDGTRVRNFAGDDEAALTDQLAELTNPQVTKLGCEVAQPMEAMRRALDPATNPAFLRDDANLMVVFLSSDDDCSLKTGSFLGGGDTAVRCASAGLICTDGDAGTPGVHANCRPREDSELVVPVADYVAFLTELKGTKGKVVVNAVAGPDDPFFVLEAGASDLILDSCSGPGGGHRPAPRINALVDAFGGAAVNGCTQDTAYQAVSQSLVDATASCFPQLRASDGDNCRVIERANGESKVLPSCDASSDGACYTLYTDAASCPTGDNVGIAIDRRATTAPERSTIQATCFVAE